MPPVGMRAVYLGSTSPRSTCRTPWRSTIETAPTAVWQTTARSPTSSIARGSGERRESSATTRNEPRSTTASRASASHVTSADGSGAVKRGAQAERRCRGEREELGPVHALYDHGRGRGPTCEVPR